jgi:signal transduction histidine kinase
MALQAFTARVKTPGDRELLEDIISDAATCVRETRQSVAGLRAVTGSGSGSGLAAAIAHAVKELAASKGVRLKLNMEEQLRPLPAEVEYNLLRIASEAVANSLKHSGANTIEVDLLSDAEGLHLQVKDDGSGFQREENASLGSAGHYGLIGMKERATQIGAEIELKSQPGAGTTVSVNLPTGRAMELVK